MKLIIQLPNITEQVSSLLVDKLYQLASGNSLTNDSDLLGSIHAPALYEDAVLYLRNKFPNLIISTNNYYIRFSDSTVEEVLKLNMGKDESEGITVAEASTTVANYFQGNTEIESFDELKYFAKHSDGRYPYNFRGCTALKSIDITDKENSVDCDSNTSIEYFYGTNGPKGFLSTGHTGTHFGGCWGITTLELTCTSDMQTNAYRSMRGLQTLIWKVSPGVKVGWYSFYDSPLLERVIVEDLDSFWTHNMGGGTGSPFQNKVAKLIVNDVEVTSVTVPQTIIQIQPGNWRGARLTSCTFHSNITSIGNWAFAECTNLIIQDLNFPNLTSLGSYAFSGTKVQTISDLGFITSIPEYCFNGCTQLSNVSLPNSLTSIGNNAFLNCNALTRVNISDLSSWLNINFVNHLANPVWFSRHLFINGYEPIKILPYGSTVNGTTELTFPQGITALKPHVFRGVSSLLQVILPSLITSIPDSCFSLCTNLASVTYESLGAITSIGPYAFENCTSLQSIDLSSVTSIGKYAFNNCSGLTSVTIPNSVTSIGDYAFHGCSSLTNIVLPYTCTTIGNNAFRDDNTLTTINLSNITSIGNAAFQGCNNLIYFNGEGSAAGELNLSNVMTIGNETFNSCIGMTSVNIGNNATSMGYSAFFGCRGLTSVVIGNSMARIGSFAFHSCRGLASFVINAVTPPTLDNSNAFNDTNNCPIYVPLESVSAYQAAPNWSDYASRIQAIPT